MHILIIIIIRKKCESFKSPLLDIILRNSHLPSERLYTPCFIAARTQMSTYTCRSAKPCMILWDASSRRVSCSFVWSVLEAYRVYRSWSIDSARFDMHGCVKSFLTDKIAWSVTRSIAEGANTFFSSLVEQRF